MVVAGLHGDIAGINTLQLPSRHRHQIAVLKYHKTTCQHRTGCGKCVVISRLQAKSKLRGVLSLTNWPTDLARATVEATKLTCKSPEEARPKSKKSIACSKLWALHAGARKRQVAVWNPKDHTRMLRACRCVFPDFPRFWPPT